MRGLSVAEQGLCFIFDCFVKYQGTWTYVLLGMIAVLLTLLHRKKEVEFLFLWYPLVLLLTVFNPFLMNKVIVKMDFESEFYRFFWLVPLPFFLAYALVETGSRLKKGWKRGKNEPVKNVDLWKRLLEAKEPHNVTFIWVKGHDGHPQNERCDELATSAADAMR